jgi:hypothetical protein
MLGMPPVAKLICNSPFKFPGLVCIFMCIFLHWISDCNTFTVRVKIHEILYGPLLLDCAILEVQTEPVCCQLDDKPEIMCQVPNCESKI